MVKGTFAKLESCKCVVTDRKGLSSLFAPATPTRVGTSSSSTLICRRSPIFDIRIRFILSLQPYHIGSDRIVSTGSIASYHKSISPIRHHYVTENKKETLLTAAVPIAGIREDHAYEARESGNRGSDGLGDTDWPQKRQLLAIHAGLCRGRIK